MYARYARKALFTLNGSKPRTGYDDALRDMDIPLQSKARLETMVSKVHQAWNNPGKSSLCTWMDRIDLIEDQ